MGELDAVVAKAAKNIVPAEGEEEAPAPKPGSDRERLIEELRKREADMDGDVRSLLRQLES